MWLTHIDSGWSVILFLIWYVQIQLGHLSFWVLNYSFISKCLPEREWFFLFSSIRKSPLFNQSRPHIGVAAIFLKHNLCCFCFCSLWPVDIPTPFLNTSSLLKLCIHTLNKNRLITCFTFLPPNVKLSCSINVLAWPSDANPRCWMLTYSIVEDE